MKPVTLKWYELTSIQTKSAFAKILEIFFALHDPTQLNRQGNDIGTQYRSAVFFHDDAQRQDAEAIIAEINAEPNLRQ